MKGRVYQTGVRPALQYGAGTWPLKKVQERRLGVAEMRMLRVMCGVTRADRTRNERVRGTVRVVEASAKAQKRRLQWFGLVMRREDYVGRRVMEIDVQGERIRERPKLPWRDQLGKDPREGLLGRSKGWTATSRND